MTMFSSLRIKTIIAPAILAVVAKAAAKASPTSPSANESWVTPPPSPRRPPLPNRWGLPDHEDLVLPEGYDEKEEACPSPEKQRRWTDRFLSSTGRGEMVPKQTAAPHPSPEKPSRRIANEIKHHFAAPQYFAKNPDAPNAGEVYTAMDSGTDVLQNLQHQIVLEHGTLGEGKHFRFVLHPLVRGRRHRARIYTSARPGYRNNYVTKSLPEYEEMLVKIAERGCKIDVVFDLEVEGKRRDFKEFQHEKLKEIMVHSRPIDDFSVPKSGEFVCLVHDITQYYKKGQNVLIFCQAGEGRSGLVAAAVLAMIESDSNSSKRKTKSVLQRVRQVNPHYVEGWHQEKYLEMFENTIAATHRKKIPEEQRRSVIGACLKAWSLLYETGTKFDARKLLRATDTEEKFNERVKAFEADVERIGALADTFMDDFNQIGSVNGLLSYTNTCRNILKCIDQCHKVCKELEVCKDEYFNNRIRCTAKEALFMRWKAQNPHYKHERMDTVANAERLALGRSGLGNHKVQWEELKKDFDVAME